MERNRTMAGEAFRIAVAQNQHWPGSQAKVRPPSPAPQGPFFTPTTALLSISPSVSTPGLDQTSKKAPSRLSGSACIRCSSPPPMPYHPDHWL